MQLEGMAELLAPEPEAPRLPPLAAWHDLGAGSHAAFSVMLDLRLGEAFGSAQVDRGGLAVTGRDGGDGRGLVRGAKSPPAALVRLALAPEMGVVDPHPA